MKQVAAILFLFASAAVSAAMPCAGIEADVVTTLAAYLGRTPSESFIECLKTHRVCLISEGGPILQASNIRELPASELPDPKGVYAVLGGIVQSPEKEKPQLCLLAAYSGGSAAAWAFTGWSVTKGKATELAAMEKGQLNSDAVPARTLGNAIYEVYVRYGRQ